MLTCAGVQLPSAPRPPAALCMFPCLQLLVINVEDQNSEHADVCWCATPFCLSPLAPLCMFPCLQLLVINVEDQDFRDMLFDYRITRQGIRCVCVKCADPTGSQVCEFVCADWLSVVRN
jgi:hypothetical protein